MKPTYLTSLARISALAVSLLAASAARTATNPRYGGTLRVELHAASIELDPRLWQAGSLEAATNEKLAALLFERLVALDDYGRFQPVLATEWSHDAANRRWQFVIRSRVKFSDGSTLRPEDVVAALQNVAPDSWKVSASGNSVLIESTSAMPDLLARLASGPYFIFTLTPDKALLGTGPFALAAPSGETTSPANAIAAHGAGSHILFRGNEYAWSGRPFLDSIDVALGVAALRAMFDLQLGKADLIELAPDLVPRAKQANLRVWSSDPVVLYGLRFDETPSAATDAHLREALSLALDRGTMASVLLQKQAEPAAALLPQWLSGYAFLFNVEGNPERAKELRRSLAGGVAGSGEPLRLRVDPPGDLPKLLGERVAVNARQATIPVQLVNRTVQHSASAAATTSSEPTSGAHLFAWRYSSLSPRAELDSMLRACNLSEPADTSMQSTEQEQLYGRERRVLEDWRILPLVEQAESVGIGAAVRDWMPARWGEWRLADVWLASGETTPAISSNAADNPNTMISSAQARAAAPGARP